MTQPLTERLRASAVGLNGENADNSIPRGITVLDCIRAAHRIDTFEATQAELVGALKAARSVLHDALMPDGIYAEDAEPAIEQINAALARVAGQ